MTDDPQNTNPLGHKIENLEELLHTTEKEVNSTLEELQKAEEDGNLEEFLASRNKKPTE